MISSDNSSNDPDPGDNETVTSVSDPEGVPASDISTPLPHEKKATRAQRFWIGAGRVVVSVIVGVTLWQTFPALRGALSPLGSEFDLHHSVQNNSSIASITSDESFKIKISSHNCASYKINFYSRTQGLFTEQIIDKARFERALSPTVSSSFIQLANQKTVAEVRGSFTWIDFLEGEAIVECPKLPPGDYIYVVESSVNQNQTIRSDYQALRVTNLGLIIRQFKDQALIKAIDLRTLKAVSGVTVELFNPTSEQSREHPEQPGKLLGVMQTGSDGCVMFPLSKALIECFEGGQAKGLCYAAKLDNNKAWVGDYRSSEWNSGASYMSSERSPLELARLDFVADRTVYRLGQDVFLKGVIRSIKPDGLANEGGGKPLQVTVKDPAGTIVKIMSVRTGPFGDFDLHFQISSEGQTGSYQLETTMSNGAAQFGSIEVIQYRKPEYEVSVLPERTATIAGEQLKVKITAKYFFGAPVAKAKVIYQIDAAPDYELRNELKEVPSYYSFFNSSDTPSQGYYYSGPGFNQSGSAMTNEKGEAEVIVKTAKIDDADQNPYDASYAEQSYHVRAIVVDASRKISEGGGSALVTAGQCAIMLQTSSTIVKEDEKIAAKVRAMSYDKKVVKNLPVRVILTQWEYRNGKYQSKKIVAEQTATTDDKGIANISIVPPLDLAGGQYFLTATATDGGGHLIKDSSSVWFCAPGVPSYMEENPAMTIELDKPVYKAGETVRAVVKVPINSFGRSSVLATLSGVSLYQYRNTELNSQATLFEFPLKKDFIPQCDLEVNAVNEKRKSLEGTAKVLIYPEPFLLTVDVKPKKHQYGPGENAEIEVSVKRPDGTPAPDTRVIVSVADESLFSIRPETHDIARFFYGERSYFQSVKLEAFLGLPAEQQLTSRGILNLSWLFPNPSNNRNNSCYDRECCKMSALGPANSAPVLQGATNGTIGPQGGDATVIQGVRTTSFAPVALLRKDFRDSAFWSGDIVTDATGKATVKFKLPDNLTSWRVTTSAVSKTNDFGSGSANFTVSKEILARLSAPRFFTMDDEGSITGLVHNYSKKKQVIRMQLLPSKEFAVGSALQREMTVEPDGVARVTWPVSVRGEGSGQFQLKALGQTDSDALIEKLPVRSFSFPAFATKNGILKDNALVTSLPLKVTPDARPGTGKFTLSVASSAIGPVLGNFDSLIDYPYGCTEQTMSRMMPSVVAMELHKKLGLPLDRGTQDLFKDIHHRCFLKLIEYQNDDGGWGWWGGDQSNPYLTAYVMEGLFLLQQAGYTVDQSMIDAGKKRLKDMAAASNGRERESLTDQAYVAYVSALWGDRLPSQALLKQLGNSVQSGPEGLSYLTMAFKRTGQNDAAKKVYEQLLGLANQNWEFTTWEHTAELITKLGERQALDYTYRFTGVETTALAMQAVLSMEPENEKLLTSIRRWILFQHDENGWNNTKTTSRVFLALLDDELSAKKGKTTNFTASALVNGKTLASFVFNQANQYSKEQNMTVPLKGDEKEMVIKKFGPGRLYYSSLLSYQRRIKPGQTVVARSSPPDLSIERKFYRLEQYTDPKSKVEGVRAVEITDEGVKTGDTILMKLMINCPSTLPYVMVDAALPSGAEVQSEQPGMQQITSLEGGSDASMFSYWWTHQDILDDRIVFFASQIPAGKSQFQALLRMEMPGKFNVNPVTFEGMYSKNIRGYSAADQITVHE